MKKLNKIVIILLVYLMTFTISCTSKNQNDNKQTETDNNGLVSIGRYPQTQVKDQALVKSLNNITKINNNGYLEYDGNEYAKVIATPFKSGNQFINGEVYYFKVEPIKWQIIKNQNEITLLCNQIIDNVTYTKLENFDFLNFSIITKDNVPDNTFANNYKYSDIREWLNNYFYKNSFTSSEKQRIIQKTIDNSESTTNFIPNEYACEDTSDYAYLLSYQDAINMKNLATKPTDYAIAKGCEIYNSEEENLEFVGYGYWWLRTPNYYYPYKTIGVNYDGIVYNYMDCYYIGIGARPVITINK